MGRHDQTAGREGASSDARGGVFPNFGVRVNYREFNSLWRWR